MNPNDLKKFNYKNLFFFFFQWALDLRAFLCITPMTCHSSIMKTLVAVNKKAIALKFFLPYLVTIALYEDDL